MQPQIHGSVDIESMALLMHIDNNTVARERCLLAHVRIRATPEERCDLERHGTYRYPPVRSQVSCKNCYVVINNDRQLGVGARFVQSVLQARELVIEVFILLGLDSWRVRSYICQP